MFAAIPVRLLGLAATGLAIAGAVTFHVVTTSTLETAVAKAQADHAAALADVARRDTAISEMQRAVAAQNAAVDRLQADGHARSRRAADAARRELARTPIPMPQDIAALNQWFRQPVGDKQ